MSITVKINGLDQLIGDLKKLSSDGTRMAGAVVGSVAQQAVSEMKVSAPADLGTIRQNLGTEKVKDTLWNIFSNAPESPYQEFGTGPMVNVPAGWGEVASQFQGQSTGGWTDFIKALTDWVRRHGLTGVYSVKTHKRIGTKASNYDADQQAAWAIARAILKRGLRPQPFFVPAIMNASEKLPEQLNKAFDNLIFKYNNSKGSTVADSEYY